MLKQKPKQNTVLDSDELSVLCWQLSLLCRAGVPWNDSPRLLLEDAQTPRLRAFLERLREPLSRGLPLDAALAEAGVLPGYLLRMVDIGQAAGRLDQVLAALSDYYRREAATRDALRRAVTYPAVMACLISLIFLVLVVRVLPVFSRVLTQMGTGGAFHWAVLLCAGSRAQNVAVLLALLLAALAIMALVFFRKEGGQRLFARGKVGVAVARGRFASAMALMLQSGLPLDEALLRTQALLAGSPLAQQLVDCQRRMEEGAAFPAAVEEAGVLVGLQAGLLSAGFRAGAAEEAMTELSRRCGAEADDRLTRLLARFEYGMVIALCLCVGLVLLSVMLPLLGVLSAVGG